MVMWVDDPVEETDERCRCEVETCSVGALFRDSMGECECRPSCPAPEPGRSGGVGGRRTVS